APWQVAVLRGVGRAAGDDRHRSVSDVSKHAASPHADHLDGLIADQSCAHHRLFHAHEIRSVADEVVDDVLTGRLLGFDDDFLPRCLAHHYTGSEMKFRTAILAALLLLWAVPALSQGCAMCYSTAKATSKDGQRAISKGVVVLLLPPLSFMTLGVWAAFRYGKKRDLEQAEAAMLHISL